MKKQRKTFKNLFYRRVRTVEEPIFAVSKHEQESKNTLALDRREIDVFIEFCRSEEEAVRLEDISKLFMIAYLNHRREQYYQIHKRDIKSSLALSVIIAMSF